MLMDIEYHKKLKKNRGIVKIVKQRNISINFDKKGIR